MDDVFEGFVPPIKNYFHMPNEWINICAKIKNLAELKVVQYVLRHTWGFHEYDGKPKPITTDEFIHGRKRADGTRMDDGTGLSNKSVVEGLKRAIEHSYLTCDTDDSDKARISKSYALKIARTESNVNDTPASGGYVEPTHQSDVKNLHIGVKNLHSYYEESTHRSEKDTIERHYRKKEGMASVPPIEPDSPSIPSFSQPSPSKQRDTEPLLSPEEQRTRGYWQQLGYIEKAASQKHWKPLAEFTKTFEQFKSLFEYTRDKLENDPKITNKEVSPGNMVKQFTGWRQEEERKKRLAEQAGREATPLNRPKTLQEMNGLEKAKYYEQKYAKKPVTVEERKQS